MNKEKYLADRTALMNEAKSLIDAGDLENFNAKHAEIEALDAKWDEIGRAAANFAALSKDNRIADVTKAAVNVEGGTVFAAMEPSEAPAKDDVYASTEYRMAFMNHVLKGAAIPEKFTNANENTKTTDAGVLIPTTVMEKIIEKIESVGMILPLVTRTTYKGGVKIPTSSVKPVASWVAEGAGSDKQKKTIGYIEFAYNKLRCAVSVSLEVDTMALPIFETTLINNVTEAMLKAVEQAMINSNGTGSPKGMLSETPPTGQALTVSVAEGLKYETLIKAEAALPLAYENGAVWFMTKKTFMAFAGLVDDLGQPIARTNYGITGRPERMLLGRSVVLNDYMSSYTGTASDGVFAFLFNPKDYVLNTNLNMTVKRYEDNETDDIVTKAVMLVDGKVVDKSSLVTLKTAA